MFSLLLLVFALFYLAWSLKCLELNYVRAKSMGVPLVCLPTEPLNILFQILESHVWSLLDRLPVTAILPLWAAYARRGWFFKDKAVTALRLGRIWALVTPVGICVQLADLYAIHDVLSRRLDVQRPTEPYNILEVFGPCISSADAGNWPRYRKVLAAPFNESIMSMVWSESIHQTVDMIKSWTKNGITSYSKDTRTLSLNVLAATGFKKSFKFQSWRGERKNPTTRPSHTAMPFKLFSTMSWHYLFYARNFSLTAFCLTRGSALAKQLQLSSATWPKCFRKKQPP